MKSHLYEISGRDLASLCLPSLVPLLVFPILVRLLAAGGLLPSPRPTLDLDRTILVHQAEASRRPQDAALLFVGDSSCLMNISALEIARETGLSALNLGMLSFLGLADQASVLGEYSRANPGRSPVVVLLLHPEALRRHATEQFHAQFLASCYQGTDPPDPAGSLEKLNSLLGFDLIRNRVLARVLPTALQGAYGRFYGFTTDFDRYMLRQRGSAIDPEHARFQGSAEYFLSRELEPASQSFRSAMPPRTKLIIGITPVPESFALPGYPDRYAEMLETWGRWIQADATLKGLPSTLPDTLFASVTHLTAEGVKSYSEKVARELAPLLK